MRKREPKRTSDLPKTVTAYVPEPLMRRYLVWQDHINLSALVQEAIDKRLTELEVSQALYEHAKTWLVEE